MNEVTYTVAVPPGVQGGDYFNVQLGAGNKVTPVRCPDGLGPGALVDIKVAHNPLATVGQEPVHFAVHSVPQPFNDASVVSTFSIESVFMLCIFILLTLAYAMPRFAEQIITSSCQVVNPANGKQLLTLYYNLFNGIGSNQECSTGPNDFCIHWTDLAIWNRIDDISRSSSIQYDAKFGWESAQVRQPL
jgi:hypothetical protein